MTTFRGNNQERYIRVKHGLLLRGISMTQAARRIGVSPGMITHVAKGVRTSRRVENALARLLGLKRKELLG